MLESGNIYEWLTNITITGILIPSITGILIPFIVLTYVNRLYLVKHEKNKSLSFLKKYSQSVDEFFSKIYGYRTATSIRYFILFEGFLLGMTYSLKILIYLTSTASSSVHSFLLKFIPVINLNGDPVSYFVAVSSLNNLTVIAVIIIMGWIFFLDSKKWTGPKLTKSMLLTNWSKVVFFSYWFFIGVLIGINIFILVFTLLAVGTFSSGHQFSISWTYFSSLLTSLKTQISNKEAWDITINYISGFLVSFGTFILLFAPIRFFPLRFNQLITDFYITDFPHIRIKTDCGEVIGQLNDAQNESMIILNENGVFKSIPWDQIKTMEIKNTERDKQIEYEAISENTENNKRWWKFW